MTFNTHSTEPFQIDLAFPELREWFKYLTGGYRAGGAWWSLLIAHGTHIGRQRGEALLRELHSAQALAVTAGQDAAVLLGRGFGLDEAVAANELLTPQEFLDVMEQELSDLAPILP